MQKDPSELNSYIAQLCASAMLSFSPEKIIMGGGVMQKKKWIATGGKKYYLNGYGIMETGPKWFQDPADNKWYYLDSEGAALTGLAEIGGNSYYFNEYGVMQINVWVVIDGVNHYFNGYGVMTQ